MNFAAKACHGGALHCHSLSYWSGNDTIAAIGLGIVLAVVVLFIRWVRS